MKKMIVINIVYGTTLIILSACSSTPKVEPQTQVMTPVYVAGTNVSEIRMNDVRNPENVEVYTVGRYIDPNNSDIMYEKSELYRLANSSTWNRRPNPPIKLSDGSTFLEPEASNTAEIKPLYVELEKRIMDYRDAVAQNNQKYAEMINKGAQDINQSAQKMDALIKQNEAMIKNQNELNEKIKKQSETTNELKKLIEAKPQENTVDKTSPISDVKA
ncbi:MAG TPA: hypothetical protein DD381_13285 [Lentisphaeria bacterium]|nr:MAG: hypothetical protein A2X47_11760 [Lentisphaerae bacterium GWF2_38_69]HBM17295.1 hypothetical protein [Lentisphaeria bacterium]